MVHGLPMQKPQGLPATHYADNDDNKIKLCGAEIEDTAV